MANNNIRGCVNGLSKGFGRVSIMYSDATPNAKANAVPGDICYDITNDKYYENTTASTWTERS
ncbi:MAG: hypothetical protein ACTSYG_08415 [Candidatus Heimdallarchaeota archaeon]